MKNLRNNNVYLNEKMVKEHNDSTDTNFNNHNNHG